MRGAWRFASQVNRSGIFFATAFRPKDIPACTGSAEKIPERLRVRPGNFFVMTLVPAKNFRLVRFCREKFHSDRVWSQENFRPRERIH
jgi:hypothetical protein